MTRLEFLGEPVQALDQAVTGHCARRLNVPWPALGDLGRRRGGGREGGTGRGGQERVGGHGEAGERGVKIQFKAVNGTKQYTE